MPKIIALHVCITQVLAYPLDRTSGKVLVEVEVLFSDDWGF